MDEPPNQSDPPNLDGSTATDEPASEIEKGMDDSPSGNPWVLLGLNAVLSASFAYTVLYLSEFIGITALTTSRFVGFTLIMMLVTYLAIRD